MHIDDDARQLEQELASGRSEKTPIAALSAVIGVVVALFVLALALGVLAYMLA